MANAKKCAHEGCSCAAAPGSKYCSPHCEGMASKIELMCQCHHPGCTGQHAQTATQAR